ncbi:hypothetical protein HPB50_013118 [Hyalomma asiaticum]|uniref:Uncharacterized protein n=1 Tax=Hyalomma asiaticum TaxID=266040 RepID=A0ACB7S610_HYAAI|nr:hypothetical protein HPB50_013118 [Hyalomma asiaticum]
MARRYGPRLRFTKPNKAAVRSGEPVPPLDQETSRCTAIAHRLSTRGTALLRYYGHKAGGAKCPLLRAAHGNHAAPIRKQTERRHPAPFNSTGTKQQERRDAASNFSRRSLLHAKCPDRSGHRSRRERGREGALFAIPPPHKNVDRVLRARRKPAQRRLIYALGEDVGKNGTEAEDHVEDGERGGDREKERARRENNNRALKAGSRASLGSHPQKRRSPPRWGKRPFPMKTPPTTCLIPNKQTSE